MADYNVIIQPEAEADLDEAFEYLEGVKPDLGFDLLAEVSDVVEKLEDNPFLFQIVDGEKRRAVTNHFKYNVFYKIKNQNVCILAILHGSRNDTWWKNRK